MVASEGGEGQGAWSWSPRVEMALEKGVTNWIQYRQESRNGKTDLTLELSHVKVTAVLRRAV